MREISDVATSIAAAQEIVRSVAQAAAGTGAVTTSIAGAIEVNGISAREVLASASELSRQSTTVNPEVEQFLSTVHAA